VSQFLGTDDVITPISEANEAIRRSASPVAKQNFRKSMYDLTADDYLDLARNAYRFLRTKHKPDHTWPRKFYNHMPAKLVRERIPEDTWTSYYKFSIERNP